MRLKPVNGIVAGVLLILAAWVMGVSFGYWLGGGLILIGLAIFATRATNTTVKSSKGNSWKAQYPEAAHSFAYGSSGIAVVPSTETIHLKDDGVTKSYKFKDVRSWKTNVETGGNTTYVGGNALTALGVGADNRKNERDNERRTGMFLTVRDIEKPIWRIRFSEDIAEEEHQQARWFEILNQTVNKN